jgi:hypothetical protein
MDPVIANIAQKLFDNSQYPEEHTVYETSSGATFERESDAFCINYSATFWKL